MQVIFPACQAIGVETFVSKKGTTCGVLRWYDATQGKVFRTMVFGDAVEKLNGLESGMACSIVLNVTASRRDDSIELTLDHIDAPKEG